MKILMRCHAFNGWKGTEQLIPIKVLRLSYLMVSINGNHPSSDFDTSDITRSPATLKGEPSIPYNITLLGCECDSNS